MQITTASGPYLNIQNLSNGLGSHLIYYSAGIARPEYNGGIRIMSLTWIRTTIGVL